VTLVTCLVVGCTSESSCDAPAASAALVSGSPTEGYLGLDPAQARAIVEVTGTVDGEGRRCSGVLVDRRHVLSAAHCDLVFQAVDGGVLVDGSRVVATVTRHPTLDVLIATLASDVSVDVAPIGVTEASIDAAWTGTVAVLSGFGDDRRGGAGTLRFAALPIVEIGDADLVVSGDGTSGGCDGDSGGPLLVRGVEGDVRVVGTLTSSSLSCRDITRFVRMDVARTWLAEQGVESTRGPCGTLGARGACFEGRAIWCDGDIPRLDVCAGRVCGWSDARNGFACIEASADPCADVDSLGSCDGGRAVRCDAGRIVAEDCSACGLACRRDPASFVARCL